MWYCLCMYTEKPFVLSSNKVAFVSDFNVQFFTQIRILLIAIDGEVQFGFFTNLNSKIMRLICFVLLYCVVSYCVSKLIVKWKCIRWEEQYELAQKMPWDWEEFVHFLLENQTGHSFYCWVEENFSCVGDTIQLEMSWESFSTKKNNKIEMEIDQSKVKWFWMWIAFVYLGDILAIVVLEGVILTLILTTRQTYVRKIQLCFHYF
jgi:hypothetical protein